MTTHAAEPHGSRIRPAAAGTWPLERVLFGLAGTVTLASIALAAAVSPWWLLLTAFAGVNQLAFAAFGDCVASLVLRRVFGLQGRSPR